MKERKSITEFMEQENGIINDLCDALKKRGFAADWFYNLLGEPTIQVHLVGEDEEYIKCFACFNTIDEVKL